MTTDVTQPRPTLVYDGDCSFCRRWVGRFRAETGGLIDYRAYQEAAGDFPQVAVAEFERAVHLFEPDGHVSRGARAVYRLYALSGRKRWLMWAYRFVPGFAGVSKAGYRFVADHRGGFDRLDRWFLGEAPVSYRLTRRWFMVGLAIVYLCAFWSLLVQIDGLYGSHGILPAREYMMQAREELALHQVGAVRGYLMLPTLFWMGASDAWLHGVCIAGIAGTVLLAIGVAQGFMALVCWACYLSLVSIGRVFLGFQWDALLLEAGFLAVFFAPWRVWSRVRTEAPPSGVMIFLCRWLAFRLMFLSGAVKLASGDPNWASWEALKYHYETQPLPPWTAWYMHQLPGGFHRASAGFMFFVELIVPFLMFGPRRVRVVAFGFTVALQVIIAATGNYGFFNLLAIVLCLTLLDDALLPWGRGVVEAERVPRRVRVPIGAWVKAGVAVVILAMSVPRVMVSMGYGMTVAQWTMPLYEWVGALQVTSPYGLFAVMTTERPEIEAEYSQDGVTWTAYRFKYKAGEVGRRPGFCAPHMPRLDWMMWFAALGEGPSQSPWFGYFAQRLLEGEPAVLALLRDPPAEKPRYVRATLYQYHFTTRAGRAATGEWWRRERVGEWFRPVSSDAPR